MNIPQSAMPGSVVKVRSKRYAGLLYHWGSMEEPDSFTGEPRVRHSEKGSCVRTTSLQEFAEGGQIEVVWVPQTWSQQQLMLQRMRSLDGKPYDLFVANCEHAVTWALTGESRSPQLALGLFIAAGLGLAVFLGASQSA
jgi:hypothetical protein